MYPLSHGKIPPGEGFKWMGTSTRPDGLKDGVHTGGCWLTADEQCVWKPLDCLPYPNSDARVPTMEAAVLDAMRGEPGFLQDWAVCKRNGRRWLIMPRLWFWPQNRDVLSPPPMEAFLLIEQCMRKLNEAGWEYNDLPQMAYSQEEGWLLVDFSAAHKPQMWRKGWHGEEWRVARWWELMEKPRVAALRTRGKSVAHLVQFPDFFGRHDTEPLYLEAAFYKVSDEARRKHVHVYASTNRPMSSIWAKIDGAAFLGADANLEPRVHTWVAARRELTDDEIARYELTWAWSPWS